MRRIRLRDRDRIKIRPNHPRRRTRLLHLRNQPNRPLNRQRRKKIPHRRRIAQLRPQLPLRPPIFARSISTRFVATILSRIVGIFTRVIAAAVAASQTTTGGHHPPDLGSSSAPQILPESAPGPINLLRRAKCLPGQRHMIDVRKQLDHVPLGVGDHRNREPHPAWLHPVSDPAAIQLGTDRPRLRRDLHRQVPIRSRRWLRLRLPKHGRLPVPNPIPRPNLDEPIDRSPPDD